MGYYSQFDGRYDFASKLTTQQENDLRAFIKTAFGDNPDVTYNDGEMAYGEDSCAIYPWACDMKAYDFNTDLLKIVKWCAENGYPELNGTVDREGEEYADFERITVRNGKVFTSTGSIKYSHETEVKGA